MLVIHPQDRSTEFLRTLYKDIEGVTILRGEQSRKELSSILYHRPPGELFLLLGHGSGDGLFRKEGNDYRCYVGRSMAYCLKRHPLVGIWCHANRFAEGAHLHGFFSGMIISEMKEAQEYGVRTTEEELERENTRLAESLRQLLYVHNSFEEMREQITAMQGSVTELTQFNYHSFYCL